MEMNQYVEHSCSFFRVLKVDVQSAEIVRFRLAAYIIA